MNIINEVGILPRTFFGSFVYRFAALNISLFPGGPGSRST